MAWVLVPTPPRPPAQGPDDTSSAALLGASLWLDACLETFQPAVPVRHPASLTALFPAEERCPPGPDGGFLDDCVSRYFPGSRIVVRRTEGEFVADRTTHSPSPSRAVRLPWPPAFMAAARLLTDQLDIPRLPLVQTRPEAASAHAPVSPPRDALAALGAGVHRLWSALVQQDHVTCGPAVDETSAAQARSMLAQAHGAYPSALSSGYLAQAYLATRDPDGALAVLEAPGQDTTCGAAEVLVVKGRALTALGRDEEAAIALGLAVRLRPLDDRLLAEWADSLVRDGRDTDGVAAWRRALTIRPQSLAYRSALATLLVDLDRLDEARTVLIEGRSHATTSEELARVEQDLGWVEEASSRWNRAAMHYQRALSLANDRDVLLRGAVLNSLAVVHYHLDALDQARAFAQEAVQLRRTLPVADRACRHALGTSLYNLGLIEAEQGLWKEARTALEEAARQYEGEDRVDTLIELADLLLSAGKPSDALDALDQARMAAPLTGARMGEWLFTRGLALAALENFSQAQETLEQAARVFSEQGEPVAAGQAWFNLGTTAERAGDWTTATRAYRAARTIAVRVGDRESVADIDDRLSRLPPVNE